MKEGGANLGADRWGATTSPCFTGSDAGWLLQDALKKNNADELPDFYNIQLERPRDDPGGYDCVFIDAAAKARESSLAPVACFY